MEVPFKHPNCLGSILSLISLINHSATNSSSTLARHGVKEIGLKSDSILGGFSLGIGEMLDALESEGTIPVDRERLNISLIGPASSYATVFSRRGGMLSGPQALYGLRFRSFLQT